MSRYNHNKFVYNQANHKLPKSYNDYDESGVDYYCYDQPSIRPPQNISIKNQPTVDYTITEHYLKINSGARDLSRYPLHYDYRIDLDKTYKNVIEVEMDSVVIPDSSVSTEPIINFDISELNHIPFLTTRGYKQIFASFAVPEASTSGHIFISLKSETHSKKFKTPLGSLSSLTIKLYDVDFQPFIFNFPNGTGAREFQHSFGLKIKTRETSMGSIQNRIVGGNQ